MSRPSGFKHSETTKKIISDSEKGKIVTIESRNKMKFSQTGKKQSPETIAKRVSKIKGKKRSEESKIRYRNSKMGIKNPMFGKTHAGYLGNKNKDTSIELKIESELQKRKIKYIKHFPLCEIACVDFYLPEYDSIIQCDGCYWHNCLTHHPNERVGSRDKDEKQDAILEKEGIKVYRLWEHEINHPEISWPSKITIDMVINNILK